MFEKLRWRITAMYVALAALIYITLTCLGLVIFEQGLTTAIDRQLKVVLSEIGHAIDLEQGTPRFRDWIRTLKTDPARSIATIQLFDTDGKMLERYGTAGIDRLFRKNTEYAEGNNSVRVSCSPLLQGNFIRGYIQIQISTKERDQTLRTLRLNACLIGALFIIAMLFTSYWLASVVTRSVQDSVQMLGSFVADASHELNTPLTILQTRLESLANKLSKQGIEEEDSVVAARALARLNETVNDLLLLSEVGDPLTGISKSPVDVSLVLDDVMAGLKERFAEKNISLKRDNAPVALVKGNKEALRRLFANLLENALRYTDVGGSVSVHQSLSDRSLRITIEDNGLGINPEDLPRIFDRFFRVDKSRSRDSGGNGLGLAIVKAIVEAHHGTVAVESTLGSGSKFIVMLRTI